MLCVRPFMDRPGGNELRSAANRSAVPRDSVRGKRTHPPSGFVAHPTQTPDFSAPILRPQGLHSGNYGLHADAKQPFCVSLASAQLHNAPPRYSFSGNPCALRRMSEPSGVTR